MHAPANAAPLTQWLLFVRLRQRPNPNVTLPGKKVRKRRTEQREWKKNDAPIIATAMHILDSGQSSKFQYEGAVRHGLRSGFCLDGLPWTKADTRAAAIVTEALRRLGAARPSWLQGQPEWTCEGWTQTRFSICQRCGTRLPDDRQETQRYCSYLCRRAAHDALARKIITAEGEAGLMAFLSARGEKRAWSTALRHSHLCEGCGKAFTRSWRPGSARFCSKVCSGRRRYALAPRACAHCGQEYRPTRAHNLYCSVACRLTATKENVRAYHAAHRQPPAERPCAICGRPFCPARRGAKYCSSACNNKAYRQRQRGGEAAELRCEAAE